jgi:hypothetical protein
MVTWSGWTPGVGLVGQVEKRQRASDAAGTYRLDAQLRAEFSRADVSLSLYLATCLVDAAYDQPHASAGALYARFLGWTGLGTGRPFAP